MSVTSEASESERGGVSEVDFLADLSQLIGEFSEETPSVAYAKGGVRCSCS